jgi:hypothetical protein
MTNSRSQRQSDKEADLAEAIHRDGCKWMQSTFNTGSIRQDKTTEAQKQKNLKLPGSWRQEVTLALTQ